MRQKPANPAARSMLSDKIELTPAEVGCALDILGSACAAILNPSRFVIGGGLGFAGFDLSVPTMGAEMMWPNGCCSILR